MRGYTALRLAAKAGERAKASFDWGIGGWYERRGTLAGHLFSLTCRLGARLFPTGRRSCTAAETFDDKRNDETGRDGPLLLLRTEVRLTPPTRASYPLPYLFSLPFWLLCVPALDFTSKLLVAHLVSLRCCLLCAQLLDFYSGPWEPAALALSLDLALLGHRYWRRAFLLLL